MKRIVLKLLFVLLAICVGSQQDLIARSLDESEIQAQVREYLRDVTELNLTVTSTVRTSEKDGTAAKVRHSAHRLIYEAGSSSNKTADVQAIGEDKVGDWETHADAGLFLVAYAFLPDHGGETYNHTVQEGPAEAFIIKYGSREKCSPWRKNWRGWHGFKFKEWCGAGSLRVDNNGVPIEASFTGTQLGPDLRSTDVPSYVYSITFQRLTIHNSPKPFLVPREVMLTVSYKKDTVVVHNLYSATAGVD